ncbi:MAG: type I glyceraldehyde-3-phosphate dehydrogenase [Candidatus Brocadiaceae bacterium]|nr:type I glyceraldehyde-3-phosphate dehydrogenase [Candidatus Brocadiaceae bacterium]
MTIKVGINGFGRIGRLVFRAMMQREGFEVAAVNDLGSAEALGYLLKYDTVHGRYPGTVQVQGENLVVDGKTIPVLSERSPKALPWGDMGVYFAVESTGVFRSRSGPKGGYGDHIEAGAKKVLLTVPAKDNVDATIVLGVNDQALKAEHTCISNASCTTNCLAPVAKVLDDQFGIKHGLMTTCHGFTNDQVTCDQLHSDLARGRAASMNIIPTSTGAAKAIGSVIPSLDGKLNGLALRVPVADGSVVDLVAELGTATTAEAVNAAMRAAAEGPMKGILSYVEDPIVSSDVIGDAHSSVFAAKQTMVIGGTMVKVVSWYDNEWGYSNRVVDLMAKAAAM